MKLIAGILLFYIQDEIYFLNKQWKRKIPYPRPTPGQFYFPFLADKRQSWWMHLNFGLNAYSFDLLCSNNFSKWIKFGYGRNMCMSLHIASYLSALYLSLFITYIIYIIYINIHTDVMCIYIYILNIYKCIYLYVYVYIHT